MIDLDWLPKIEQNELIKKLKKKISQKKNLFIFQNIL